MMIETAKVSSFFNSLSGEQSLTCYLYLLKFIYSVALKGNKRLILFCFFVCYVLIFTTNKHSSIERKRKTITEECTKSPIPTQKIFNPAVLYVLVNIC